jgi:uncharacterized membrane protein
VPDEPSRKLPEQRTLPPLERGRDLSRIVAFTDGVFAIAITLLVLQIDVPQGVTSASDFSEQLLDQSPDFTAFAISFAVIGHFWISNHRFMRAVREFDRGLMLRLLLYLAFVVLIPFSSQLMGEYSDRYDLSVLVYIVNMVGTVLGALLMADHVLKRGLVEPEYEWDVGFTRKSTLFTGAYFILTIPFIPLLGGWTPLLWIGLRMDPFERRRNAAYKAGMPVSPEPEPSESEAAPSHDSMPGEP